MRACVGANYCDGVSVWSDILAMVLACFGPQTIVLTLTALGMAPLSLLVRGALWALMVVAVLLVTHGRGIADASAAINFDTLDALSFVWGVYGAVALLLGGILTASLQNLLGHPAGDRERSEEAAALPWHSRFFLVLTAAVVEETLFRGIAIGIGREHIGVLAALLLSIIAFVLAHLRWSVSHLPTVAMAGIVLGALFLFSGDLWSCILAHFIVDARSLLGPVDRQAPAERAQFGAPPPAQLVLAVTKANGTCVDALLASLAVIPGVRVWIVAERPCNERVKAEVARLGIDERVRWLEWDSASAGVLVLCEAVVLLSRCKLSDALAREAQLAGRPILVIEGALAGVAPDVDALSVPRHNAAALSQALRRVLENPELAERLVAARRLRSITPLTRHPNSRVQS